MKKLDLSQNTELDTLSCVGNELTELDLSKNEALVYIDCRDNSLQELDISNCREKPDCYVDAVVKVIE